MNLPISAITDLVDLVRSGKLEALGEPFDRLLELLRNYIPASDLRDHATLERLFQQHEQISAALFSMLDAVATLPIGTKADGVDPQEVTDGLSAWLSDLSSLVLSCDGTIARKEALAEGACSSPPNTPPAESAPSADPPAVESGSSRGSTAGGEVISTREPDPRCTATAQVRAVYGDGCLRKFKSCEGCPLLGPAEAQEVAG